MTTPTLHSKTGLTCSIFKPLPRGDNFLYHLDNSTVNAYQHIKAADGGCLSCDLTFVSNPIEVQEWIESGIGRRIINYNDAQLPMWQGFVNTIDIAMGGLSITIGPLLDIANKVAVSYQIETWQTNPPIGGGNFITDYAQNLVSQGLYGILETVLNASTTTDTDADQYRNSYLSEYAYPQTSQNLTIGQANTISITLHALGYVYWLDRFNYSNPLGVNEVNLSDKIKSVITAEPNGFIDSSTNGLMYVASNTLQVNDYEDDNKTGLSVIKSLVAAGDSTNARYVFGIDENRLAYYKKITSAYNDYLYIHRLTSPDQRITTAKNVLVKPWDVQPGQWIFIADFLAGRELSNDLKQEPRAMFIEQVTYTAPYGLSIQGGKNYNTSQIIAQMGLGGIGGLQYNG